MRRDEFTRQEAYRHAQEAADSVGRLAFFLRRDVDTITINDGNVPWGGGNRDILIHTPSSQMYRDFWEGDIYDETILHEAAHTSLDQHHRDT